jgi:hypothetical protein
MGGTPEALAEFRQLSGLVAEKKATPEQVARWRVLRKELAGPLKPVPPPIPNRKDSRKDVRSSRKLRIGYAAVKGLQITFTEEIGAGGIRLTLHTPAEVGALFALRLELAGSGDPDPPFVQAKVVWCRREANHFAVGLEFVGLRPEDRERIEAWAHAGTASKPSDK